MVNTYANAGVDIEKGDELVRHIKAAVVSTFDRNVLRGIGSFGAFYGASFKEFKSPVLVSSVDGVGTKLMIAQAMDKHETIGEDLVNHCVNDIAVCGAKPLYFMDYFATGRLRLEVAQKIFGGFIRACKENKCSLIGGETAEMPGFYDDGKYDVAGTIVGLVEKNEIIDGRKIRGGDILIGLASSGLHTNGYSLARATLLPAFRLDQHFEELGSTLGDALLAVHRSYLKVISDVKKIFSVRGMSHITGGGIVGNTNRILPRKLKLNIDWKAWQRPAIFELIQKTGDVPEEDMRRSFNLGIGLIIVVPQKGADEVIRHLKKKKENPVVVGEVR